MSASFFSTESQIQTHLAAIKAKEEAKQMVAGMDNLPYIPTYEIMWREAAVEKLRLEQMAKEHLSQCEIPLVDGDIKKFIEWGVDVYRSDVDKLQPRAPTGQVVETKVQQDTYDAIRNAAAKYQGILQRGYDDNGEAPGCLRTFCLAVSWWNDGNGFKCSRCGQLRKIILKEPASGSSYGYSGLGTNTLFELEDHQVGSHRSHGPGHKSPYFRCPLAESTSHVIGRDYVFLGPHQIAELRAKIADGDSKVARIWAVRDPAMRPALDKINYDIRCFKNQLAEDDKERVYAAVYDCFNSHPLGVKMSQLPGVWDYIRVPSKPAVAPRPLPFESYAPGGVVTTMPAPAAATLPFETYAPTSATTPASSRKDCIICMDAPQSKNKILSCGHKILCDSCIGKVTTCPLCRQKANVVQIFRA